MLIKFLSLFLLSCSLLSANESVFFLHGFIRRPYCMKKMEKPFQKEGYNTCRWGYPSREKTIEQHAAALLVDLEKTAQKNPGEPINFVTHSLGGIIVRAALSNPDCPYEATIGKVVLLSPPNRGSQLAHRLRRLGIVRKVTKAKAGKQLLATPSFDYLGDFPKTVKVLVISGTSGWWNPFLKENNFNISIQRILYFIYISIHADITTGETDNNACPFNR